MNKISNTHKVSETTTRFRLNKSTYKIIGWTRKKGKRISALVQRISVENIGDSMLTNERFEMPYPFKFAYTITFKSIKDASI